MATIWADTFESGDPLTTSYADIVNAETNSSCGRGGGWGCRGTGTGDEPQYGEFYYDLPTAYESEYFRVTLDIDGAFYPGDGYGGSIFELRDSRGWWLAVLRDDEADSIYVDIAAPALSYVIWEDGILPPETWKTVQIEVWCSTGGGSFVHPNADGRIRLTVDGAVVADVLNVEIMSTRKWYDGVANQLSRVYVIPGGNADNFGIYDTPDTGAWVDIADYLDVPLNSAHFPSGRARVLCELWADTGSPQPTIQARLYNSDDDVSVGESVVVTSATPVTADFPVILTAGTRRYRAQVTSDTPEADLFYSGAGVLP